MTKKNQNKSSERSTWKDVAGQHDNFLKDWPELKKDKKVISVLKTMSLWDYENRLKQEERYVELVWIQPNLVEANINAILSVYFLAKGGKKRDKENDNLIHSLNLQHKIKLLYSLNFVNKELYSKLEDYRTTRNNLVHKLMKQVRIGKDIDKECERFCNAGFYLHDQLHEILMEFVRQETK